MSETATLSRARSSDIGSKPTQLLQILREIQEESDWISPEIDRGDRDAAWRSGHARFRASCNSTRFSTTVRAAAIGSCFPTTSPTGCSASLALIEHMLKRLKLRARPDVGGRRGERRHDVMHRDVRSGPGHARQQPRRHAAHSPADRRDLRTYPQRRADRRMAGGVLSGRRQHPSQGDSARRAIEPGVALDAAIARGRQGMMDEMKRSKLRGRGGAGFPTADEMGRRAKRSRRGEVHRLQRGRRRAGTFKDRVLLNSYAVRVLEGMAIAGFAVGSTKGFIYLRGEYRHLLDKLQAEIDLMRRSGPLGDGHSGLPRFRFRHRNPHGRGRLHLRRRNGAGRIARRKARPPAGSSALHGVGRLSREADGGRQRRDARPCNGNRHRRRVQLRRSGARNTSTGTKLISVSGDCATARCLRISVRRDASRGCSRIAGRTRSRRFRSAALRASV